MPARETVIFGRAWWRKMSLELVRAIKVKTKSGEGVDGNFPPYSDAYRDRKVAGKAAGKAAKGTQGRRGSTKKESAAKGYKAQASRSATPDLTLTGAFLRDLKGIAATDNSCTLGWPAQGAKVEWTAAQGRAVSSDEHPLAADIEAEFAAEYDRELDRRAALWAVPVTTRFKL